MENIETKIDHTYHVFKYPTEDQVDEGRWNYVADGMAVENITGINHRPWLCDDMDYFAEVLVDNHLKYLKQKDCFPENIHGSYISFSYTPPYESAISSGKIQHTQRLTSDEITQFEKSVVKAHNETLGDC